MLSYSFKLFLNFLCVCVYSLSVFQNTYYVNCLIFVGIFLNHLLLALLQKLFCIKKEIDTKHFFYQFDCVNTKFVCFLFLEKKTILVKYAQKSGYLDIDSRNLYFGVIVY